MARSPSDQMLQERHRPVDSGAVGTMSDAQLVDRFVSGRSAVSEAAFEALVIRHGPMVLRVCRGVIHNGHDVEEAFQAVFFVLARRAGSIRRKGSVASWLFGVAQRVAVRAKRGDARRKALMERVAERKSERDLPAESNLDGELLNEEIRGLPERLREPVVLCYLEGLTYEAAADRLDLSAVAIRGRLARARERLRVRLIHRGLTIPAALLAAGVTGRAEAAISEILIRSTLSIALKRLPGNAAAVLARGVITAMSLNQLKVAMILLCVGVVGSFWAWPIAAEDVTEQSQANPGTVPVSTDVPANEAKESPPQTQELKVQSTARLKSMRDTAARIEIRVGGNEGSKLELGPEPLIRWDNQRAHVPDGVSFVWFEKLRPQAIGGIWIMDGQTLLELHSLSQQPLNATLNGTTILSTSRPGISWQAIAGAPAPAGSRAERLRQMKRLAEGFIVHAVKSLPAYEEGSVWHMRMMVQPIHRYAEQAAVDGAIFAFAQGTDPEAYLILESRPDKGTHQWHFAFAAACVWELHARRGGDEVWFRPKCSFEDADKVYVWGCPTR